MNLGTLVAGAAIALASAAAGWFGAMIHSKRERKLAELELAIVREFAQGVQHFFNAIQADR